MLWLPIAGYLYIRSILQFTLGNKSLPPFSVDPIAPLNAIQVTSIPASTYAKAAVCFVFGNLIWTILEYTLHRFLFHIDRLLPDHPAALTVHFLMHGIHHYLPMDR